MMQLWPDASTAAWAGAIGAGLALGAAGLVALYRQYLPRPIPGIPYDPAAARSVLGDMPRMVRFLKGRPRPDGSRPTFTDFMLEASRTAAAGQDGGGWAPIVQVFLGFPRSNRPVVFLLDHRAALEVLTRPAREFDRSRATKRFLGGLIPHHHMLKKTHEAGFKEQRRLLHDLMAPTFLRRVAAEVIYEKAAALLVPLWEEKGRAAKGRPFQADQDVFLFALEAVIGFSFGDACKCEALAPQLRLVQGLPGVEKAGTMHEDVDEAVKFPATRPGEDVMALVELTEALEKNVGAPFVKMLWPLMAKTTLRRRFALRNELVLSQLEGAVARLEERSGDEKEDDESWFRSAVDLIVAREKKFAEKDGRRPDYYSKAIQDEVYGFLVAGHDTSSTTLCWGLKLLSSHKAAQDKLRAELRAAFPLAAAEKRLPSVEEIHDTTVPYLDAAIEEVLRLSQAIGPANREVMQDMVILGHRVPAGTTVYVSTASPGVSTKAIVDDTDNSVDTRRALVHPVDEDDKGVAKGSRRVGVWDADDIEDFVPERWLVKAPSGDGVAFDSGAGPMFSFGLGPRGCYGRRLAYVELRTMITLVIWRFILDETPESLSSWGKKEGLTQKPVQCYVRIREAY